MPASLWRAPVSPVMMLLHHTSQFRWQVALQASFLGNYGQTRHIVSFNVSLYVEYVAIQFEALSKLWMWSLVKETHNSVLKPRIISDYSF